MCHSAAALVFTLNVFCVFLGVGAYIWYAYVDGNEERKSKVLETLSKAKSKALQVRGKAMDILKNACGANGTVDTGVRLTWVDNPVPQSVELPALEAISEGDLIRRRSYKQDGYQQRNAGALWEAHTDEDGQSYYFNPLTNESVWEKPKGFDEGGAEPVVTEEWEEHVDDEGNVFYYNTSTEETTWDDPRSY